jgi:tRNA G18 (ribose-2'-O)-methylase SpoU
VRADPSEASGVRPPRPDPDLHPVRDLADERLEDFADLRYPSERAALERSRGIFTVEGAFALEALAGSEHRTRAVLVDARRVERLRPLLAATGAPCYVAGPDLIEGVAGFAFHRGVLAVAERPGPRRVDDVVAAARTVLVIEAVNDHENLGALFRNAAAFGVDAVVLDPTAADPLYRRSVRVSVGHVLRIPFARCEPEEWPAALDRLAATGLVTVALTPDPSAEPLAALLAGRPARVALMVGAEGPGLSPRAMCAAERRVRIPIAAGVDSLNVATAAAVALSALHGWG